MTKEEIKQMYSMRDIVSRYGIQINRSGFCSCPFHTGDHTPSLKVYKDNFHCHACGADGDIFTWVMQMDNLTFKEALVQLGGEEKPSFSVQRKIDRALAKRKMQQKRRNKAKQDLYLVNMSITAYRNVMSEYEPYTQEWSYCYNKLQYQIYIQQYLADQVYEKR